MKDTRDMRLKVIAILFVSFFRCFSQFPSTDSYELFNEVPKAKHEGDTVYTSNSIHPNDYQPYVLEKIDSAGWYTYHRIGYGGKKILRIKYNAANKVSSYYYHYKEFAGTGKGYFVIHYYLNGNIKDYAHISFYALNQPKNLAIYDSLSYKEKNRSKIPCTEYRTFYKRGKVYLFKGMYDSREIKKTIRRNRHLKPIKLIDDFPFPTYILE